MPYGIGLGNLRGNYQVNALDSPLLQETHDEEGKTVVQLCVYFGHLRSDTDISPSALKRTSKGIRTRSNLLLGMQHMH